MSNDMLRALTGSADRPEVTLQRRYATDPDDLWQALTDPERLARWLGRMTVQPTGVGEAFEVHLGEAADDVGRGAITRCDPPHALACTWIWGQEAESTVTVTLTPIDQGATLLRLQHSRLEPVEAVGYGIGWEDLLTGLAVALAPATSSTAEAPQGATPTALEPTVGATPAEAPTAETHERAEQRWRTLAARPMSLSRTYAASPSELWRAFTTAEGLRTWWWTHWEDVAFEVEARLGGGYRITVPSQQIDLWGTYLRLEPASHLAFTWCWRGEDGVLVPDEAVDIRFIEVPGGTRVDLRHTGPWQDDAPAQNYRMGWEFTLEALRRQLG